MEKDESKDSLLKQAEDIISSASVKKQFIQLTHSIICNQDNLLKGITFIVEKENTPYLCYFGFANKQEVLGELDMIKDYILRTEE